MIWGILCSTSKLSAKRNKLKFLSTVFNVFNEFNCSGRQFTFVGSRFKRNSVLSYLFCCRSCLKPSGQNNTWIKLDQGSRIDTKAHKITDSSSIHSYWRDIYSFFFFGFFNTLKYLSKSVFP